MKPIICLLFFGCFVMSADCLGKDGSHCSADANGISAVVEGNTDFALTLYGKIKDDSAGNLFFSPYSISTALAMVYGGANGQTQTQMAETLRFTLPEEQLYPAFGTLQKQLIQEDKSHGRQFLAANALWLQEGAPFLKEFLDLTAPFEAGCNQLDFAHEAEASRKTINSWVAGKTKDKIQNLLPLNSVDCDTELVITNAVYFKGQWRNKFKWWKTRKRDFFVSDDQKVKVPLMHLKEKFKYHGDDNLQAVELPYKDGEMSMLVLLPKDTDGLKEMENTLTAEHLDTILSKMWMPKVEVYLPRFKITWGTVSLKKTLIALGMPDAFAPEKADFSGITGRKDLWMSDIFHKAFVEVNEKGTEAAAGTGFALVKSALPEPVFRADHPFLFLIRDNHSGSILFVGRVINPESQK